jgi:hypothetical protein
MNPTRMDQILMTLDKTVSWTGISDRIRAETLYEGNQWAWLWQDWSH